MQRLCVRHSPGLLLFSVLAMSVAAPAGATDGLPEDKAAYHLFRRTPEAMWRPLSADRPDITESPRTVDAGAFQLEMSFFEYAKDDDADSWSIAPFNLKLGLLHNADIQFVFEPHLLVDTSDAAGEGDAAGVGDLQVRLKINLWGNDEGRTAFAVMPFVKIPTAADDIGNDEFEGGIIFPFEMDLNDALSLGLMAEFDLAYDDADDDYDLDFVHTAVLGVAMGERLGAYLEGVGIESTEGVPYRALLGAGLTYELNSNTVLDGGVNVGLHGDVDDVTLFTGVTVRF